MLSADSINSHYYIKSYAEGVFYILQNQPEKAEIVKNNTFFISNEKIEDFNQIDSFADLTIEMIKEFDGIDILIIGSGEKQLFPDKQFLSQLSSLNFSVEFMNNAAASRTFNVLVNDERKVAAIFFV